jgi:hypothetical protein
MNSTFSEVLRATTKIAAEMKTTPTTQKKKGRPSYEAAKQIVQSQGITSREKWRDYCKAHPELHLPQKAAEGYGLSWPDFLGKAKSEVVEAEAV